MIKFGKDWENFKFKVSVGEVNCLKREKTPDPPGLEPGTLLVMSNALTTQLWDQAEPRRRRQVFHSKGSSQHVPHILMALRSFSRPGGSGVFFSFQAVHFPD